MILCKRNTGLTVANFNGLFNSLGSIHAFIKNKKTAAAALYMYLMKMRTGIPNGDLGNNFHVTKQTVARLVKQIRPVLKADFASNNVNYIRSREDLLEHNTVMSNGLFDPEKREKVMLICDGTYFFIDKSRNYVHQKKTYSSQKKRNFLKAMNVTTCDGTIVYIIAPFPAVQNDASILKYMIEETTMFDNLAEGDILLLDRGFRDVVPVIEEKGLVVKMPSFLQTSERKGQLTTIEANRSRLVTAIRFVIETRNGHLKTIFKYFDTILCSYDQVHISEDLEICSALINKYFITIESNRGCAPEVARRMLNNIDKVNELGNIITSDRFKKYIRKFTPFVNFNELPTLTKNQLFWISFGGYQIKQAESYTQMHIKQSNHQFIVGIFPDDVCRTELHSFYDQDRDLKLFQMKLNSRFRSQMIHKTYVLIDCNYADEKAVLAYYCECQNGWRTIGCCSHIMTLIAFLLHTKGQNLPDPANFLDGFFFADE